MSKGTYFQQFDLYCDTEVYSYLATPLVFISWAVGAIVLAGPSRGKPRWGRERGLQIYLIKKLLPEIFQLLSQTSAIHFVNLTLYDNGTLSI